MSVDPAAASTKAVNSTAFVALARAGYVARGAIYILMGLLAIGLVDGTRDQSAPNQKGAIATLLDRSGGTVLVGLLAVGLAGYAVWRLAQAIVGRTPEHGRYDTVDRLAGAASGVTYTMFFLLAVGALVGHRGSTSPRTITSDLLTWPAGRVIVALVGLAFIGVALYQLKLAITGDFDEYSKTHEMAGRMLTAFYWFGRVGHAARAVVFGLVGAFFVHAAVADDATRAVGVDGALMRMLQSSFGTVTVIAAGVGLLVFGVYSVMDARYRKV